MNAPTRTKQVELFVLLVESGVTISTSLFGSIIKDIESIVKQLAERGFALVYDKLIRESETVYIFNPLRSKN